MEVMTTRSALNPNAPIFVPSAYRMVEDFSDQWWALIQSTPWFRDYWLQECYKDPQDYDQEFALPADDFLDSFFFDDDEELLEREENYCREVVKRGGKKWERKRVEVAKYGEKVPKYVNVKMSPRMIQQPR